MPDGAHKPKRLDAPKTTRPHRERRCRASSRSRLLKIKFAPRRGSYWDKQIKQHLALPLFSHPSHRLPSPLVANNSASQRLRNPPRCRTAAAHKTNLSSYYETPKIILPGSPTPSVGFNSSAAIGPSPEGRSPTWNQSGQLLSKMASPRRTYDLPLSSRHSEMRRRNTLLPEQKAPASSRN